MSIFKKMSFLGLSGILFVSLLSCGGTTADKPNGGTPKTGHDPITLESFSNPGTYIAHNFVDGKCTLCGEETIFSQDPISDSAVAEECDQKGSVVEISYETRSYAAEKKNNLSEEVKITKKAYVYLPYGYDAEDKETKYDVLYALHGMGLDEGFWFARGNFELDGPMAFRYNGKYCTENVLDNLMKDGRAKKTIVVTPTFYSWDMNNTPEEYKQYNMTSGDVEFSTEFGHELINDLMPYIAENFNTYAASSSDEDLKANRDHQGYVGLSMGSMTSYSSILNYCLEYFSYIGSYSGSSFGEDSWKEIVDNKNTTYKDCDIKYWFVGCGKLETASNYPGDPFGAYRYLKEGMNLQSGSDIKNGDNCEFVYTNKSSHDYQTWITDLYNSMLVFFQK